MAAQVSWIVENGPLPGACANQEKVRDVQVAASNAQRRATTQWAQQWENLRKRELIAASEVVSSLEVPSLRPQDLRDDVSTAGHACVTQLRSKALGQVQQIQAAVRSVKQHLISADPGPSYVSQLTASIDKVDHLLNTYHAWSEPAMQALDQQANDLESEIEALALKIEEEMLAAAAAAGYDTHASTTQQAPRSKPDMQPSHHPMSIQGEMDSHRGRHMADARARDQDSSHTRHAVSTNSLGATENLSRPLSATRGNTRAASTNKSTTTLLHVPRRATLTPEPSFLTISHSTANVTSQIASGLNTRHTAGGSTRPGPGSLAPEVVEFEEFVAAHGEYGGWEREDHDEFERVLKACAGDYTHAIKVCEERCVGFTKTDIMKHASWHMDYMDLLVRKRLAVAKWRAARDAARAKQQASSALLDPGCAAAADTHMHAPASHAAAEAAAAAQSQQDSQREAAIAKELVSNWKQRKEQAEREAAERAAEAARQAAEQEALQVAERQAFNKMKLELYKQAKQREAEAAAARARQQEERDRALKSLDANQVAAIQARTCQTLSRREALVAAKAEEAAARAKVQQQLLKEVQPVEVAADPQRLVKGTAAHMRRVEAVRQSEPQKKDSSFILHSVPRLHTPAWRQGVDR